MQARLASGLAVLEERPFKKDFQWKKQEILIEYIVSPLTTSPIPHAMGINQKYACLITQLLLCKGGRTSLYQLQQHTYAKGVRKFWALSGKLKHLCIHRAPLACMKAQLRYHTIRATQKCLEGSFLLENPSYLHTLTGAKPFQGLLSPRRVPALCWASWSLFFPG